jgi:hypothetical protein
MDAGFSRNREEVKAKQLAALKKLGHLNLKLDEYESTSTLFHVSVSLGSEKLRRAPQEQLRTRSSTPMKSTSPSQVRSSTRHIRSAVSINRLASQISVDWSQSSHPSANPLSTRLSTQGSSPRHPRSSAPPRASFSMGHQAAVRLCSPKPSPRSPARRSSTSPRL